MPFEISDFFKANYYTEESVKVKVDQKISRSRLEADQKINHHAKYIFDEKEDLYRVFPKLSAWKVALSIALPVIPIVMLIKILSTLSLLGDLQKSLNDELRKIKQKPKGMFNSLIRLDVKSLKRTGADTVENLDRIKEIKSKQNQLIKYVPFHATQQ